MNGISNALSLVEQLEIQLIWYISPVNLLSRVLDGC